MSKTARITKSLIIFPLLLILSAVFSANYFSTIGSEAPAQIAASGEVMEEGRTARGGLRGAAEPAGSKAKSGSVAFLATPETKVFRGENNVMLFPDVHRVDRDPVKGTVFGQTFLKVEEGDPSGELTFTDETKSAVEAQMELAAVREFLLSDAQYLPISISASESLLIDVQGVEEQGTNTVSLVGKVKDRPFTLVRLAFHDGAIAGSVELHDEPVYYQYGMAGNGNVAIRQVDMEKNIYGTCAHCDGSHKHGLFDDFDDDGPLDEIDDPISAAGASDDYIHVIDGVLSYTTSVKNDAGGTAAIEAKILLSTGFINDALANSNITDTVVTLLGTVEEVGHNKGLPATFVDLKASTLNVASLWAAVGADYMAVVYNGGSGVADLDGNRYVTGDNGLDNSADTIVHEFGHLLGCAHSWGDNDGTLGTNTVSSNFGWRFQPEGGPKTRTVMSYSGGWATLRIGHFSSPTVFFRGEPTGAVAGHDASQDETIDPQLVSGGAIGSTGSGYDGTNPELGADNRQEILNNRADYTKKGLRKNKTLLSPSGGQTYFTGRDQLIYWVGGDNTQPTEVELYKGGVYHSTIASYSGAHVLTHDWVIPDVPGDDDYSVRITFEGEAPFMSGDFEIQPIAARSEDIALTVISGLPWNVTLPSIPDVVFEYDYSQPANGTVSGTPPNLIYTSNAGATTDSFTYSLSLEGEGSETATVSIEVRSAVAHWPLDAGAGSVVSDLSGNGHHGALTSATWSAEGQVNGALEFKGGSDSVSLPPSAFADLTDQMTLSIWVNGDTSRSVADSVFTMLGANESSIMHVRMGDQFGSFSRNYWASCVPEGCNTIFYDIDHSEVRGQWNHYVFVKNADSGTMRVYLNGVLQKQLINFLPVSGTVSAYLGSATATTENYHGLLDNVRLYDTEMSPEAVAELYRRESVTAPIADDQTVEVARNGSAEISLTSSSSSAIYTIVDFPSHGFLSPAGSGWNYTPDTNFEGPDHFTFSATADGLTGEVATVTLDVVLVPALISMPPTTAGSGYHASASEAAAFRSTDIPKNFDVDADDAYGTAGYYFYGNGVNNTSNSDGTPSWVTSVNSLTEQLVSLEQYFDFDNPTLPISNTVADWAITSIALVNTEGTTGDLWAELMTFTVDESAPRNFRLGVMSGNEPNTDGRWDSAGLRLSFEGGTKVVASGLEPTDLGMVFFDVQLGGGVSGTFSIEGQNRNLGSGTRGPSIAGITFDDASQNLSPYAAWLSGYPNLRNTSFASDPDQDGLTNGLEYVLGGDPSVAGAMILPEVEATEAEVVFTFNRLKSSITDATMIFEYSSSLLPESWTSTTIPVSEANGVVISPAADGLEKITLTVDRSLIEGEKLFGRIRVQQKE